MVKRAVAVVIGACAGLLLWHFVGWLQTPSEDDVISVESCVRDKFVDCVAHETPAPAVAPCKAWLSGSTDVSALSRCLHEARRDEDGVRFDEAKRARLIGGSI